MGQAKHQESPGPLPVPEPVQGHDGDEGDRVDEAVEGQYLRVLRLALRHLLGLGQPVHDEVPEDERYVEAPCEGELFDSHEETPSARAFATGHADWMRVSS